HLLKPMEPGAGPCGTSLSSFGGLTVAEAMQRSMPIKTESGNQSNKPIQILTRATKSTKTAIPAPSHHCLTNQLSAIRRCAPHPRQGNQLVRMSRRLRTIWHSGHRISSFVMPKGRVAHALINPCVAVVCTTRMSGALPFAQQRVGYSLTHLHWPVPLLTGNR